MKKSKYNIIFAGTPDFALPAFTLLAKEHNILLALTKEDKAKGRGKKISQSVIKTKALELGIEVFQPKSLKDDSTIDKIKTLNPDFIVVVAYGLIIPLEIIYAAKHACLNIHGSLLPYYRGAAPVQRAIIQGENKTGISIMQLDKGMDTGPVFKTQEISINQDDTAKSILQRLSNLGANLLTQVMDEIFLNKLEPIKQDNTKATYAPKLTKNEVQINWNNESYNITNLIKGAYDNPIAFTYLNNSLVKILKASVTNIKSLKRPGTINGVKKEGMYIASKDFDICVTACQIPGKKPWSNADILNSRFFIESEVFCQKSLFNL